MGLAVEFYTTQASNNQQRFYSDETILTENTDRTKYITITVSNVSYNIYNSAAYYDSANNSLYCCILLTTSGTVRREYFRNGSWRTAQTSTYSNNQNGIYYGGFNNLGLVFDEANLSISSIIGYEIPLFTNYDEYLAYITSPIVTFQWSSVPAISGKNGILSLPVLIDTDGNPVSNGSASDFSTLPDNVKVRSLADLAVQ